MTPYKAVYGVPPPSPPRLFSYTARTTSVQAMEDLLRSRNQILSILKENLLVAHDRMKHLADRNRTDREFTVGDWVYLRLQPYRQHFVAMRKVLKLSLRYYGPYQVVQRIGPVAYKLDLPATSRIHLVFHVSNLKKKLGTAAQPQVVLPPVTAEGVLQPHPEAILDRRMVKEQNRASN
ncbi:hypothetical protein AAC387_Pa07g1567 [Persea americana]